MPNIPTTDQEPICVLKLELNNARGGVKYLKIYERDEPEDIVENFAIEHNLSEQAKDQLLRNVFDQLKEETDASLADEESRSMQKKKIDL